MGAIADAFVAFARPLIDQTDGSHEELEKALSLGQLCYNVALLPVDEREEMFADLQGSLGLSDDELDDFRRSVLDPMIARHEQMFPLLHQRLRVSSAGSRSSSIERRSLDSDAPAPARKSTVERYAPCPCGSGKKYKFCCGAKTR